jgi:hypothetical protein
MLSVLLQLSKVDPQTILVAGIALATLFTAVLTTWQQFVLNKVKKTGEATHMLSNSAMGAQLQDKVDVYKELAVMAHRLADYTSDPEAKAAAIACDVQVDKARLELREHLIRQAKVDAFGQK